MHSRNPIPEPLNPSCLQTTAASEAVHPLLHMVPQTPLQQISTRPRLASLLLASLISPSLQSGIYLQQLLTYILQQNYNYDYRDEDTSSMHGDGMVIDPFKYNFITYSCILPAAATHLIWPYTALQHQDYGHMKWAQSNHSPKYQPPYQHIVHWPMLSAHCGLAQTG